MGIYFHFKIFRFVSNYYIQFPKNIPIIFGEYILNSKNLDLNQGNIFWYRNNAMKFLICS